MSGALASWRPALRMARRDLGRHRVRALLTCLLVALPAVVATVAALAAHNSRWTPEVTVTETMGGADGQLLVTRHAEVGGKRALWLSPGPAPGGRGEDPPARRDPATVDLAALLPAGSELVRTGRPDRWGSAALATGGRATVRFLELGSPVVAPLASITAGTAPTGPDEVAAPAYAAAELGLLDAAGEPVPDARVELADGSALRVVGVYESEAVLDDGGTTLVASPDSRLNEERNGRPDRAYLVDLPDLTRPELRELTGRLNAAGVAFRPRDSLLHPRAWGLPGDGNPRLDVAPLVVGALCVLVGLVEVVLLVGAAFAVAARRQVRDLGLLAANGGASTDLRRVLLAQGLVLGVLSSVLGTAAGVWLFLGAHSRLESSFGSYVPWREEIDWRSVVLVAVLGSTTSVVAALLPGWSIGRLTPVAALSGRFPVRPGESRAHRGAFVLAGAGLAVLLLGGWATSHTFRPRGGEVTLAPAVAALGLLLLLAGAVWATPWLVRRTATLGSRLPFSGRYAFRDAGRHRFRSASAVVALAVTVAGAVMASFLVSAAVRSGQADSQRPEHALEVYAPTGRGLDPERITAVRAALEQVLGEVEMVTTASIGAPGRLSPQLVTPDRLPVVAVDRDSLVALLGPGQGEVLEAFDDGSAVQWASDATGARADAVRVRVTRGGSSADGTDAWTIPAVTARPAGVLDPGSDLLAGPVVAPHVVAELGLRARWPSMLAVADRTVTDEDLDRLGVYGLEAWSDDTDVTAALRLQWGGLGLAGLVTALVVGVAVALAAAERREDTATLAAVGASPGRRRALGAAHGFFLGLVGAALGGAVGVAAGTSLGQLDGLPGVDVPWAATAGTLVAVLVLAPVAGWLVTPSRLDLSRRTA